MLTTKEAAELLGVTAGRVRQWIVSGELRAVKYGRDRLIHPRDLDALRQRNTKRGPKPGPRPRKERPDA